MVETASVSLEEGQVAIDGLTIDDPTVVEYFEEFEDEGLERQLERVIGVGVTAMQAGDTASQTELVRSRFEKLERRLEEDLEAFFGDRGRLPEMLEDNLGENGRLTDLFDPHADGTPISKLRAEILDEVRDFRETMIKEEGAEEVRELTPLSGFAYEDELWEQLEMLARIHGDEVDPTGTTTGVGRSKKGDFVVEVNANGPRFVIEAKDTSNLYEPTMKKELSESITNRNAAFGVLLAKKRDQLPDKVGWFNEYEGNQLVAAVTDGEDDRLFGPLVRFVYSYARTRALAEASGGTAELDLPAVRAEIDGLQSDLAEVTQIKRRCTEIENLSDEIRRGADEMQRSIEDRTQRLRKML
jgi:hypothetical protein